MKKACMLLSLLLVLLLTACRAGGDVSHVSIPAWTPSQLYSDSDINAAMQTVQKYFSKGFSGCTLIELRYSGDDAREFRQWAVQYDADEAIVIHSDFDVDASGGDGSLNPNSTYWDWEWILVRDQGGKWVHADHGYG